MVETKLLIKMLNGELSVKIPCAELLIKAIILFEMLFCKLPSYNKIPLAAEFVLKMALSSIIFEPEFPPNKIPKPPKPVLVILFPVMLLLLQKAFKLRLRPKSSVRLLSAIVEPFV